MSLRSLVRSQWWWVVVLVLWVFALLGINSFPFALEVTLLILVVKAVEYLTRPAQAARQVGKHNVQINKIEKLEKKNKNYGLILGIIIGFVLFDALAYVLNIFGAIIYFIVFYLLERNYERKNRLLYYTGYYALRVGAVMVIIAIILLFMFLLGIFSTVPVTSTSYK